ncbi:MAG TPA: excalibur calcium-binding domain-containing protein [Pseudolabrys sp.]|nr:excalibur calcium-binding domain-containing protein [Pseudolabrys sp.]
MALALHEKPSQPDVIHNDSAGAEKRLRDLKGRFNKVSGRWDRGPRLRRFFRQLSLSIVVAICSFGFFWYLANSPWPIGLTLKHLAASPSCTAARMVGLAPSRIGRPGYWKHLDADRDGIACENFTRAYQRR